MNINNDDFWAHIDRIKDMSVDEFEAYQQQKKINEDIGNKLDKLGFKDKPIFTGIKSLFKSKKEDEQ